MTEKVPRSHLFRAAFNIGQIVYLKVRGERVKGMVVSVTFSPSGEVCNVGWADGTERSHYAIELTDEYEPDLGVCE